MNEALIRLIGIGWDLIYDNGYIEIDPEQCGYTTFLGKGLYCGLL